MSLTAPDALLPHTAASTRDMLVLTHLRLATRLARRYGAGQPRVAEAHPAAIRGLERAAELHTGDAGEFQSFAIPIIIAEIKLAHRKSASYDTTSPHLEKLRRRIEMALTELGVMEEQATVAQLAQYLETSIEEIVDALYFPDSGSSGERPVVADSPRTSEAERLIYELRFIGRLTVSQISATLGVGPARVAAILGSALSGLHADSVL